MLQYLEEQLALDVLLPGTPHEPVDVHDVKLLQLLGLSGLLAEVQRVTRGGAVAERQRSEYVTRRRAPRCAAEACAYGNLPSLVLAWAQGNVRITHPSSVSNTDNNSNNSTEGKSSNNKTTTTTSSSAYDTPTYEGSDATLLMWAAYRRHLPLVRFLVDQGADVNARNGLGHSVLQWAVYGGSADVVRYLLDHGADASLRDCQGHDAAFSAVQRNMLPLLLLLTEDARVVGVAQSHLTAPRPRLRLPAASATCDKDGGVSLLLLRQHDEQQQLLQQPQTQTTAQSLLLHPATQKAYYVLDPTLRDVEGHSLLHWAAYCNNAAMCAYLLDYWSYDVNASDYGGRTALIWAAREGYAEVVECLLLRGAHRDVCDQTGCTAMQYARLRRHHEAVYVLRELPPLLQQHMLSSTSSPASPLTTTAGAVTTPLTVAHTFDDKSTCNSSSSASGGSVGVLVGVDAQQQHMHNNNNGSGGRASAAARGAKQARRYVTVRERRASGTLCMLRQHVLFALMSCFAPLTLLIAAAVTSLLPPAVSYIPSTVYLCKNALWTSLLGTPERGSGSGNDNDSSNSNGNSSSSGGGGYEDGSIIETEVPYASGLAKRLADALRGPWLYRLREPANVCLLVLLPLAQLYAWTALGLTPVLFAAPARGASGLDTAVLRYREDIHNNNNNNNNGGGGGDGNVAAPMAVATAAAAALLRDVHTYPGGALLSLVFASATTMVPCVLLTLLAMFMTTLVLCKMYEGQACVLPAQEGKATRMSSSSSNGSAGAQTHNASSSLSSSLWPTSPLWRIVSSRRFAWLHPRAYMTQRHVQVPVRAFYCRERDVLVRGYDGYSIALDSPIGAHNHVYFVLCVTSFALLQLVLFTWGATEVAVRTQCVGGGVQDVLACASHMTYTRCGDWYSDAWHGVRSVDYLQRWSEQRRAVLYDALPTTPSTTAAVNDVGAVTAATAGLSSALATATTLVTPLWVNTAMNVLLRGLPVRMCDYAYNITANFVQQHTHYMQQQQQQQQQQPVRGVSYAPLLRLSFLLQYYVRPLLANACGVWVLHFSLVAFVCSAYVCLRQWAGVWRGATRIELANPLAPSSPHGDLVSIFADAAAAQTQQHSCGSSGGNNSGNNRDNRVTAAVVAASAAAAAAARNDASAALVVPPYDVNEEAYYRAVAPAYARPSPLRYGDDGACCCSSRKSIYATSRYGVVNVLAFLLGQSDRRWRHAMAVSASNTPDPQPLLTS